MILVGAHTLNTKIEMNASVGLLKQNNCATTLNDRTAEASSSILCHRVTLRTYSISLSLRSALFLPETFKCAQKDLLCVQL